MQSDLDTVCGLIGQKGFQNTSLMILRCMFDVQILFNVSDYAGMTSN